MIDLDEAVLTESLLDILPKSQHGKIKAIIDAVKEQDVLTYSVTASASHIEMTDVRYGAGSVGLDACGNLVRATLGYVGEEWEIEA